MDIFSKKKRSQIMSKILGKDTTPEIVIRKLLFSCGYRYRKNVSSLPGKPDIVLPKYKTGIFINGCFWHGHDNCYDFKLPSTRTEYWDNKIKNNKLRDKRNIKELKKMGFLVLVIWQCSLRNKKAREKTFVKILQKLEKQKESLNNTI